jgi:hypothetical protein
VVVLRFGVQGATLATTDHDTVGIGMGHVDQQLGFATTTTMCLIAAALAQWRPCGMDQNVCAVGFFSGKQDHIILWHLMFSQTLLTKPVDQSGGAGIAG